MSDEIYPRKYDRGKMRANLNDNVFDVVDEEFSKEEEYGSSKKYGVERENVSRGLNEEFLEPKKYGFGNDDVSGGMREEFLQPKQYGFGKENAFGGMNEEFLEPKKYDPTKKNRCSEENPFTRYQSIAAKNPFEASGSGSYRERIANKETRNPLEAYATAAYRARRVNRETRNPHESSATYRERLANKEAYFPPKRTVPQVINVDPMESGIEWTVPPQRTATPFFQTRLPSKERERAEDNDRYAYEQAGIPKVVTAPYVKPQLVHKRSASNPQVSPFLEVTPPQDPPQRQLRHKISKSVSDPTLLHQNPPAVDNATKRKPTPIYTSPAGRPSMGLSDKDRLSTITEYENTPQKYKLEAARSLGSPTKITRSPLKKFFGDGGLLGRTPSKKDKPDPKFKKTGFVHWSSKIKQYMSDMGKEISDSVPRVELIPKRAVTPRGPSKFPVSLSPYEQGDFYFQLELMLNNETNKFIIVEFEANRVTADSVQTIKGAWENKGRPQVLAFRYDIATQRELVLLNCQTMHFGGINARNKIKMWSTLGAWKSLAKEISVHTFCQPDSAVKKHLFDAERVLELVDASETSMLAFKEMRTNILGTISREEKYREDRRAMNGKEVAWPPSKFDNGESF